MRYGQHPNIITLKDVSDICVSFPTQSAFGGYILTGCVVSVSGVWRGQVCIPGDGADEGRGAVGSNPQAEVFLRERSKCCSLHHYKDCWLPPLPRGEETLTRACAAELIWTRFLNIFSFSSGSTPRPEAKQHPVHGRLGESRLHQDLWFWIR